MLKIPRLIVLLSVLSFIPAHLLSQVMTGTPPFGSFGGGPFDTINLGNLNVHFAIPILNKAGRGVPFSYALGYDSSVWYPATSSGVVSWVPLSNWGWVVESNALGGSVTSAVTKIQYICTVDPGPPPVTQRVTGNHISSYTDPTGTTHPFNVPEDPCGYGTPISGTAFDGSGWTITYHNGSITATSRTGATVVPNVGGTASYTDPNGNQLTANGSGQYFDTLSSTTPVLTQAGSATPASPTTLTYTAPSGGNASYTVNYTQFTIATKFGVSGVNEYGPLSKALVSSIVLPDGSSYNFTYEQTPTAASCIPLAGTAANCVTARIASVTLPTGGSITYVYSGGSAGIESDGTAATLTRTLSPGGQWQYVRTQVGGTGPHWQTQITSPPDPVNTGSASNVTLIDFQQDSNTTVPSPNFFETQRQVNQGASTSLGSIVRCYNANYASCASTAISSPITQMDVYSSLPNGSTRASEILYNSSGLVTSDTEYGYGVSPGSAPSSTYRIQGTAIAYAPLGKPSSVVVSGTSSSGWTTLASTIYSYDGAAVIATTGTPQHIAVTGARGNLTTMNTKATSGVTSLYRQFTYYDTGMPNNAMDASTSVTATCASNPSACTTYNYSSTGNASCGNSFITSISEPLGLTRSITWNCTGGTSTQVTDENNNLVKSVYTDSDFWRPSSVYDQLNNQTTISYIGQTAAESTLSFNSGSSVSDSRTTVDGFGRRVVSQRLQAPGSTSYDTAETDYDVMGRPTRSTMLFSAAAGGTNSTAPGAISTYDALGRPLTVTDANGGKVTYTYTNNDVLETLTGTQTFQKQLEYDGLGRLTSVCEISTTLPSVASCGQSTSQTGLLTSYTYDGMGHLLTVTQNAQAAIGSRQTRAFVYDMLGRVTSESNPETGNTGVNGTIVYTYDSISPCADGTNYNYPGSLVQKKDNAGNFTCYSYDALHRLLKAGNSSVANTVVRKFFYDSETSYPTGVTISNGKMHMVEAQTVNTSSPTVLVTDELFSYSARGETTDVYEMTPHSGSGVYYHTTASFWPTGSVKSLSGIPGVPTINYGANGAGLDGEGRYTQVSASSGTNPVSSVSYSTSSTTNPLGALTGVTLGSADTDSFTYDPNTGRMKTYSFSVHSQTDKGTLYWNTNGTLQKLVIADNIPGTADSQTCNYQYDDVQRLASSLCGSIWSQNFSYDSFGNITKSGSSAFAPLYSSSTNQFTSLPGVSVSYDANGNLLTDNLNTYTWDQIWGTMLTVTAGSTTVAVTYDALGRIVENATGSVYNQFVYGPTGAKLATVNGTSLIKAYIALPGGAKAVYTSSGLSYYRHPDWMGSSRLTSTATAPTSAYSSSAYAPFGEQYAQSGTSDASFTGQDPSTASSLYDFQFRRLSGSQGRWVSPDPLGRGAVTLSNPQTWNRYVYVSNDPLNSVDPLGLFSYGCATDYGPDAFCPDDGGGGGGGPSPFEMWCPECGDYDGTIPEPFGTGGMPGGGGGGGASAITAAELAALSALQNPLCAKQIDGGTGQAEAFLQQNLAGIISAVTIQSGTLANPDADAGIQTNGGTVPNFGTVAWPNGTNSTITISVDGPFFSGDYPGDYDLGTPLSQAATLLHEIGHAVGYFNAGQNYTAFNGGTGVLPDGDTNPTMAVMYSESNTQHIDDACFPGARD